MILAFCMDVHNQRKCTHLHINSLMPISAHSLLCLLLQLASTQKPTAVDISLTQSDTNSERQSIYIAVCES